MKSNKNIRTVVTPNSRLPICILFLCIFLPTCKFIFLSPDGRILVTVVIRFPNRLQSQIRHENNFSCQFSRSTTAVVVIKSCKSTHGTRTTQATDATVHLITGHVLSYHALTMDLPWDFLYFFALKFYVLPILQFTLMAWKNCCKYLLTFRSWLGRIAYLYYLLDENWNY